MRRLFFHEESIHEVSRRYLEHEYTHTYIRTSRNQYVPHFFKVGGIITWKTKYMYHVETHAKTLLCDPKDWSSNSTVSCRIILETNFQHKVDPTWLLSASKVAFRSVWHSICIFGCIQNRKSHFWPIYTCTNILDFQTYLEIYLLFSSVLCWVSCSSRAAVLAQH